MLYRKLVVGGIVDDLRTSPFLDEQRPPPSIGAEVKSGNDVVTK
jgi:hypothetical protein